jgi:hypothetical protein
MPLDQTGMAGAPTPNPTQGGGGQGGMSGMGMDPMGLQQAMNDHLGPMVQVMGAQFKHHQDRLDQIEESLHSLIKLFHDYGRGKMRDGYREELMKGPHGEHIGKLESVHSDLYGMPFTDRIMDDMEQNNIPKEQMHDLAKFYIKKFGKHFGIEIPDDAELESSGVLSEGAEAAPEAGAEVPTEGEAETPVVESAAMTETPIGAEEPSAEAAVEPEEEEADPVMKTLKHIMKTKPKTANAKVS